MFDYSRIIPPIESSDINKYLDRLIFILFNVKWGFLIKYIQYKNTKNPTNIIISIQFSNADIILNKIINCMFYKNNIRNINKKAIISILIVYVWI